MYDSNSVKGPMHELAQIGMTVVSFLSALALSEQKLLTHFYGLLRPKTK